MCTRLCLSVLDTFSVMLSAMATCALATFSACTSSVSQAFAVEFRMALRTRAAASQLRSGVSPV